MSDYLEECFITQLYEDCNEYDKEISELNEHIAELEQLVLDIVECNKYKCGKSCPHSGGPHSGIGKKFCEFGSAGWIFERMKNLGINNG